MRQPGPLWTYQRVSGAPARGAASDGPNWKSGRDGGRAARPAGAGVRGARGGAARPPGRTVAGNRYHPPHVPRRRHGSTDRRRRPGRRGVRGDDPSSATTRDPARQRGGHDHGGAAGAQRPARASLSEDAPGRALGVGGAGSGRLCRRPVRQDRDEGSGEAADRKAEPTSTAVAAGRGAGRLGPQPRRGRADPRPDRRPHLPLHRTARRTRGGRSPCAGGTPWPSSP